MRCAVFVLLFSFSALAQQGSGTVTACGSQNVQFEMKRDDSQHALVSPDPGKARVYFVQDIGAVNCLGSCSTKIAVDGQWVGANQHNSYFSVSLEPGEHHVCVKLGSQSSPHSLALAHFTADPGKVYYYRVRPFLAKDELLTIDPIDDDEGRYLVSIYPLCASHAKP